jgi:predicted CXXCH cytochrome family protein
MNHVSEAHVPDKHRWPMRSAGGLVALGSVALALAAADRAVQEKPTTETADCTNDTCHADVMNRPVMHRPTAQGQCLVCHEYEAPAEHRFALVTAADELCWECHDLGYEDVVHAPVDEGNCMACHDPHGSDQRVMLVKAPTGGLCYECHDLGLWDRKFVHGPVAAQGCLACHDAHESSHEKLLTAAPDELCLSCHAAMTTTGPGARHRHEALEKGCAECHDAHASDFRYQLRSEAPQLCFSCHDDVKRDLDGATIVHGAVVAPGGCATCHSPHYSPLPRLLRMPQEELCLTCHNEPVETADGRTLENLAVRLQENPNLHGPVREGNCAACHPPHAGENLRLLTEAYPADLYAPFEFERYELCFGCHLEELVEDESGTGLTGFRDGDRNLHWLHVNRTKGRTCRVCHAVHASRRPFHIREAIPFGSAGWMLRINYERADDGGSCAPDCHEAVHYRRGEG